MKRSLQFPFKTGLFWISAPRDGRSYSMLNLTDILFTIFGTFAPLDGRSIPRSVISMNKLKANVVYG